MDNKELAESLKRKRTEYLKIAEAMTATINALQATTGEDGTLSSPINDGYNPTMSLSDKISFFFKKEGRFLHNRELAEMAHSREPNTETNEFVGKFSSILSRLKKEGHITSIQIGKSLRNTFWGNPKWLDNDGNVIKGHEINEKFVIDSNKKKVKIF